LFVGQEFDIEYIYHSDFLFFKDGSVLARAHKLTMSEGPSTSSFDSSKPSAALFECNICLDTAKDAVISLCGHLFW